MENGKLDFKLRYTFAADHMPEKVNPTVMPGLAAIFASSDGKILKLTEGQLLKLSIYNDKTLLRNIGTDGEEIRNALEYFMSQRLRSTNMELEAA